MQAAGIVLAGGRSTRMGVDKAGLAWRGGTLLAHVVEQVAAGVGGPVVVVRAAGQALPALPGAVRVVDDPRDDLGPVQGLAAGLQAARAHAEIAFVSATDTPLLHQDYVRRVLAALDDDHDVALPIVGGHHQPFGAAYRTALAALVDELVAAGKRKPAFVFARARVKRLAYDDRVARDSTVNLNDRQAYEEALRSHGSPPPS